MPHNYDIGDIEAADRMHRKRMVDGSRLLAECIFRARLGIETNAPESLPLGTGLWSPADVTTLTELHRAGLTEGQIAIRMDRTTPQVNHAIQWYVKGRRK